MQRKSKARSNADKARKLLLQNVNHAVRAAERMKSDAEMNLRECDRALDDAKHTRYLVRELFAAENSEGGGMPRAVNQPPPRFRLRVVS